MLFSLQSVLYKNYNNLYPLNITAIVLMTVSSSYMNYRQTIYLIIVGEFVFELFFIRIKMSVVLLVWVQEN